MQVKLFIETSWNLAPFFWHILQQEIEKKFQKWLLFLERSLKMSVEELEKNSKFWNQSHLKNNFLKNNHMYSK